ncbi:amino acid/polyamine transporter I [Aspergillus filifer]
MGLSQWLSIPPLPSRESVVYNSTSINIEFEMDPSKCPNENFLENSPNATSDPELEPASKNTPTISNAIAATTTTSSSNPETNDEPHLTRTLTPVSTVGLAFTITNTWMSYTATFGPSLAYGGVVTVLFGLIGAAIAQWAVLLGVCEILQVVERSGGCYAFTFALLPPKSKYRNPISFTVGMINLLGFWIGGVAAGIYTAQSIFGLVGFWHGGFEPGKKRWEVYLGFVGVALVSLLPTLTIPSSKIKYLTTATLSLTLLVFITIITVCSTHLHHDSSNGSNNQPQHYMNSRSAILTTHINTSGWPDSIAWLLSISLGMYSFSPTGTVVHIVEDVKETHGAKGAGWTVAMAINRTMALGLATGVSFITVLLLGIKNIEAVQEAYMPSLEAFNQGSGSMVIATGLQSCLVVLFFTTVSTQWVSVSRIAWSLARDNALPYSAYFSHISPAHNKPLRTTFLSAIFFIIFGVIYIASSTAFNSVVNMATLLVNIAYAVPQGVLLFGGRGRLDELVADDGGPESGVDGDGVKREVKRRFDLGKAGYIVNAFSVVWTVFVGVLFCFPTRIPTEAGRMN